MWIHPARHTRTAMLGMRGENLMHWFWRGTIAVVTGPVCGLSFTFCLARITKFIDARIPEACEVCLTLMPTALCAVVIFLVLTRLYGPKYIDPETRCRKCQCILRGITEPRCPECGERI
jgi:hypothetical protein